MDLTVIYLIILISIVVFAVVILTIFQGKANHKIHILLNEVKDLRTEIKSLHTEFTTADSSDLLELNSAEPKALPQPSKKNILIDKIKEQTQDVVVEEFVGGSIAASIGIALFAMGVSFFVKHALDMHWINDVGRVSLALTASCILILTAYALNKRYKIFSSVLLGGAMAVLFYSFSIAHYQYNLFGRELALFILLLLTAFTTFISISYKRPELASLIALASFTAPFVAGFGFEKPVLLFSYILTLNIGMLIVAYYQKWLIINIITSLFTAVFYTIWFIKIYMDTNRPPFSGAFIFLTLFYLIFFAIFIANNIRKEKKFIPIELSIVLVDNMLYYTAGLLIIERLGVPYKGLFTLFVSILNLIFFIVLYRNKKVDNSLLYLLFGLSLIFLTLTPAVELVGKTITLVWSLQIVLLLWLAQKINVLMMRLGSLFVTVLMLLSLVLDMHQFYVSSSVLGSPKPLFINIGFLSNIMATVGLSINTILLKREENETFIPGIKIKYLQIVLATCAALAFYFSFYLELKYYLFQHFRFDAQRNIIMGIFNLSILSLPAIISLIVKKPIVGLIGKAASILAFLLFFLYYHFENIMVRDFYLENFNIEASNFQLHYIQGAVVALALLIGLFTHKKRKDENYKLSKVLFYVQSVLLVTILSTETINMLVVKHYNGQMIPSLVGLQNMYYPLTLLFIVLSAFFMVSGAILRSKDIRNLSLVISFAAILKFFIYDYSHNNQQQEIITYVILGLVIVIDAFIYQLRKVRKT